MKYHPNEERIKGMVDMISSFQGEEKRQAFEYPFKMAYQLGYEAGEENYKLSELSSENYEEIPDKS